MELARKCVTKWFKKEPESNWNTLNLMLSLLLLLLLLLPINSGEVLMSIGFMWNATVNFMRKKVFKDISFVCTREACRDGKWNVQKALLKQNRQHHTDNKTNEQPKQKNANINSMAKKKLIRIKEKGTVQKNNRTWGGIEGTWEYAKCVHVCQCQWIDWHIISSHEWMLHFMFFPKRS